MTRITKGTLFSESARIGEPYSRFSALKDVTMLYEVRRNLLTEQGSVGKFAASVHLKTHEKDIDNGDQCFFCPDHSVWGHGLKKEMLSESIALFDSVTSAAETVISWWMKHPRVSCFSVSRLVAVPGGISAKEILRIKADPANQAFGPVQYLTEDIQEQIQEWVSTILPTSWNSK